MYEREKGREREGCMTERDTCVGSKWGKETDVWGGGGGGGRERCMYDNKLH